VETGDRVIDICAGQGHSAIEYIKVWRYLGADVTITGIDSNERMLDAGKRRVRRYGLENSVFLEKADAMNMKPGYVPKDMKAYQDDCFDAALCVFGAGGLENPKQAFCEMLRIIKPGGRIVIIDALLPTPGLHTTLKHVSFWNDFRLAMMKHLWGWENHNSLFVDIENSSCADAYGAHFYFETISKALCPEPIPVLKKAIAVYVGVKTKLGN